ncbi:hypothetical protein [Novosphingobium sp. M1R2S20]|uniref:SnoaL-like protein n=1 Tax=Novosphingobium rhizovicinum TaxID=3228928 RepID=A0ABV3REC4_9SPHN
MMKAIVAAATISLCVTGCESAPDERQPDRGASVGADATASASPKPPSLDPPDTENDASTLTNALSPEAAKGEQGARAVLAVWTQALENRNFARAWEQFHNPPAARDAYVAWWQRYRTLDVTVEDARVEGAAGSLYYAAPTTITGTTTSGEPFRLEGQVILRRVNDVPGATAAQLRWHIDSAVLKEA